MSLQTLRFRYLVLLFTLAIFSFRATNGQFESRTWKDKTKTFEVDAKLLKWSNGHLLLLKPDGKVVTLAEKDLSTDDTKYLKSLGLDNPFAGGRRMTQEEIRRILESPDNLLATDWSAQPLPSNGQKIALGSDEPLPALVPDPPRFNPTFDPAMCELEEVDYRAQVFQPVLVDDRDLTFAVSIYRKDASKPENTFGRWYVVKPGDKKPQIVLDFDQSIRILDHDIKSSQTLALVAVDGRSRRSGDLVLFEGLGKGKPKAVIRWRPPGFGEKGFIDTSFEARFIDGDRILAFFRDALHIVSLKSQKALFRIDGVRSSSKYKLSPGGRYLFIPSSRRIDVIDTQEGKWIGKIDIPIYSNVELAFSPKGDQLAIVGGNHYFVWDFKFGKMVNQFVVGNASGKLIGWVDDQKILTELGGLIDMELGISLWKYHLPSGALTRPLSNGVAYLNKYRQTLALNFLPVPHASVKKIIEQVEGAPKNEFLLVQKGTPVRVKIELPKPHDEKPLLEAMKKTVANAGWTVSDNSDIEIICRLRQGKQETLRFSDLYRLGGSSMEVKVSPMYVTLEVRSEGFLIWSRKDIDTIPPMVSPEKGKTIQDAVLKYEKPTTDFLRFLKLPTSILRPTYADHVGTSSVDNGKWRDR